MTAHCLRWVNTRRPPVEPIALPRAEALPELLHPCGVWGDVLESPTEREEMGPSESWPPPDMDSIDPPPGVTMVFPAVRDPAGREAATVVPSRQQVEPPARRQRPTAEERRKRSRGVPTSPAAAPAEEPSTPSAAAPKAPPAPPQATAVRPQVPEETQAPAAPATPQPAALLETPLARALTGECYYSALSPLLLCLFQKMSTLPLVAALCCVLSQVDNGHLYTHFLPFAAVFLFAEEIVLPSPPAEAREKETTQAPSAPSAEAGPSQETRMALAKRLLGRAPRSLAEADEALTGAGFQMSPGRKQ